MSRMLDAYMGEYERLLGQKHVSVSRDASRWRGHHERRGDRRAALRTAERSPRELIRSVASQLEEAGVRYCHWKSNAAIDRSATETTTSISSCIARTFARSPRCSLVSASYVRPSPGASVPSIESFYGYDVASGRLVHVHAHYQLVLGDDRTKNCLPIEDAYLDSTTRSGLRSVGRLSTSSS